MKETKIIAGVLVTRTKEEWELVRAPQTIRIYGPKDGNPLNIVTTLSLD